MWSGGDGGEVMMWVAWGKREMHAECYDNLSEILHLEGRDWTLRIHYIKMKDVCHIGRVFRLAAMPRPALVLNQWRYYSWEKLFGALTETLWDRMGISPRNIGTKTTLFWDSSYIGLIWRWAYKFDIPDVMTSIPDTATNLAILRVIKLSASIVKPWRRE
jgi:hypothetical protein